MNAQPSNSLIIESKNPSPPIIPLREVKIQNSGLSLFDNEPVSINTVRTTVSQNLNKVQYNCNEIAIKLRYNDWIEIIKMNYIPEAIEGFEMFQKFRTKSI